MSALSLKFVIKVHRFISWKRISKGKWIDLLIKILFKVWLNVVFTIKSGAGGDCSVWLWHNISSVRVCHQGGAGGGLRHHGHGGHAGVGLGGGEGQGGGVIGWESADIKLGSSTSVPHHLVSDHWRVRLSVLWLVTQQLWQMIVVGEMSLLNKYFCEY